MCFFDQHRFVCGDWKWGPFRQHCAKEYRVGQDCGMKLVMQTVPVGQKCKLCEKIDTKIQRRAAEVERVNRWQKEGNKFQASIAKSMGRIRGLDSEIYDLQCERNRRLQGIDTPSAHHQQNLEDYVEHGLDENLKRRRDDHVEHRQESHAGYHQDNHDLQDQSSRVEYRQVEKMNVFFLLPITFDSAPNPASVMAIPDTAADINAISLKMAQRLGLSFESQHEMMIRLINGKPAECCGVVEVTCRFGKLLDADPGEMRCTFYVFRKMASPLIMSHEFLENTNTLTLFRKRLVQRTCSGLSQFPLVQSLGDTQEVLLCSLNGENVGALPDTGSDVDVLSLTFAEGRGLIIEPKETWIMFVDKTVKKSCGICVLELAAGHGAKKLSKENDMESKNKKRRTEVNLGQEKVPMQSRSKDRSWGTSSFRDVIYCEFYILEDIEIDVLISAASLESLQVYTRHTDCLIKRAPRRKTSQMNRIILLGPIEKMYRRISCSWLSRTRERAESKQNVPFEETLSDADQRENARREDAIQKLTSLVGAEKLQAETEEAQRQNEYDQYRALVMKAFEAAKQKP